MPPSPAPQRRAPVSGARSGWLDSLRGLAAVQVLALHLLGAFWLPAVTGEGKGLAAALGRSPLALLWDGESAVYLFFVLSGVVLAGGFGRLLDAPGALLAARAVRLGVPAAAAAGFGFLLFQGFAGAHAVAGALLGGSWMNEAWTGDGTLWSLLWEAGPASLLLGFHPDLAPLPSLATAFNAPLWTLSIEMQGSALVLVLLLLHRRWGWRATLALALPVAWDTPYAGFVVGALASLLLPSLPAQPEARRILGAIAGLAGALLCWQAIGGVAEAFAGLPGALPGLPRLAPLDLERNLGATLGFGAIAASGRLRRLLDHPALRWLGRMSFPVYLVHWPVILGPGAATFLGLEPLLGIDAARCGAALVAVALTLVAALTIRPLDDLATGWSRGLRSVLARGARPRAAGGACRGAAGGACRSAAGSTGPGADRGTPKQRVGARLLWIE